MITDQKFKVGQDPKFVGPDEIPLLPKFLTDQNPDQASHYHLLLKEWWESVYENLNRIRDMVVNFQVADLKEGTESDLNKAKQDLSAFTQTLVDSLDQDINNAISSLEGTLTQSITDHINSTSNPHGVTADQLNISTVGKTGDYGDLDNIPNLFAPSAHSHAISDVNNLQSSLDAKADSGDVFSGDYGDLSNKPTLFSGDYDDLTNKPALFSGDYDDLSNKPTIPTVPGVATTSANGLMSSGDKTKLDGIPTGGSSGIPGNLNAGAASGACQFTSIDISAGSASATPTITYYVTMNNGNKYTFAITGSNYVGPTSVP